MRTVVPGAAVAALALGLLGPAAPAAAQERPAKYEYAELRFARGFGGPPGAFPGGPGAPAFPAPAVGAPGPVGGPPGFASHTTLRWTTGEEEQVFKEWEEMAEKLKAPPAKKDSPPTVHKLRVLNKLSADGWEILDRPAADAMSGTWTFRRRVP